MDALQMLEKHKEVAEKEVADQEASDLKKRTKEEQRTERAEFDNAKRAENEARLKSESSVTELLQALSFTSSLSADVTGAELQAFAKANKAQLRTLGVDTSKLARKVLMPELAKKLTTKQASKQGWVHAPLLAIVDKSGAGKSAPAPAAGGPVLTLQQPTSRCTQARAADKTPPPTRPGKESDLHAAITPPKPPEKRARRAGAGELVTA